jgi:hypothetical protein
MDIRNARIAITIPNSHEIYQNFPSWGIPKYKSNRIFGMKIPVPWQPYSATDAAGNDWENIFFREDDKTVTSLSRFGGKLFFSFNLLPAGSNVSKPAQAIQTKSILEARTATYFSPQNGIRTCVLFLR